MVGVVAELSRTISLSLSYRTISKQSKQCLQILTTFIDRYVQHSEDILCIRYHTCVDSSWHTFTAPSVEEDGTETSSGVDGNCVITNITTIRVPPQTTIGSCFI